MTLFPVSLPLSLTAVTLYAFLASLLISLLSLSFSLPSPSLSFLLQCPHPEHALPPTHATAKLEMFLAFILCSPQGAKYHTIMSN